jgi:proteasome-associated ATPase
MSDHNKFSFKEDKPQRDSKKSAPTEKPYPVSASWEGDESDAIGSIDRLIAMSAESDPRRYELFRLRQQVQERELTLREARAALEKLEDVLKKVTAPANRIGVYLGSPKKGVAHIAVGGSDYYTNIDPRLTYELNVGTRVLLNEAFVVIGDLGYEPSGPVGKIADVLSDGRLRVGEEHGTRSIVLHRSSHLKGKQLKHGDEIRLDTGYRVALEHIESKEQRGHFLEEVPEMPWKQIGGQHDAIEAIKNAIEMPLVYPDLFKKFHYTTPKGFLLYGPPGCGKTLIGKATAYNLTLKLKETTGKSVQHCFIHIKGPEILNMWVGESERMVREIFAAAREKRKEGYLPFLFIDEAESILGTRRASRFHNMASTLVPMFCSEMDGIESLHDVVVILASNRADLIDPAILRPGRIDRKIKVQRPTKEGAKEIFRIYLTDDLPFDPATKKAHDNNAVKTAEYLAERAVNVLFAHNDENRFLEVTLRSGRKDMLYRGDLISGAIIASIVDRAKETALKRAIKSKDDEGISEEDLLHAIQSEYVENDIFPPTDITEDWLMLLDHDPENVVKVSPIHASRAHEKKGVSRVV